MVDFVHNVHKILRNEHGIRIWTRPRPFRATCREAGARREDLKSGLVPRYVIEKSLETQFPGISFRDSLAGREAYLTGRRVAAWEVVAVYQETKSVQKAAQHFGWPLVLVKRALAYAKAFPEEIERSREEETNARPVIG